MLRVYARTLSVVLAFVKRACIRSKELHFCSTGTFASKRKLIIDRCLFAGGEWLFDGSWGCYFSKLGLDGSDLARFYS